MKKSLWTGFLCLIVCGASLARAEFLLDEEFAEEPVGGLSVTDWQEVWQSWTVGTEGTLGRIDLQMYDTGTDTDGLTLWIADENRQYVASQAIPLADIPKGPTVDSADWVEVWLDEPVDLQQGSQWRIWLTSTQTTNLGYTIWSAVNYDGYAGGEAWYSTKSDPEADYELLFRTYMEEGTVSAGPEVLGTIPVPEPSTYAMIFGTAALGFAVWRRKAGGRSLGVSEFRRPVVRKKNTD